MCCIKKTTMWLHSYFVLECVQRPGVVVQWNGQIHVFWQGLALLFAAGSQGGKDSINILKPSGNLTYNQV
jgi:hypothetical protein